jgi:DNA-binding FrmR family transcriptional regulator
MTTKADSVSDAEKQKLVKRLSRIRGQVDALQRALVEQDAPSAKLLQQATACRGAMDGFIAEVIEDHIREQVVQAETKGDASRAAEELIGIVHTYLT